MGSFRLFKHNCKQTNNWHRKNDKPSGEVLGFANAQHSCCLPTVDGSSWARLQCKHHNYNTYTIITVLFDMVYLVSC